MASEKKSMKKKRPMYTEDMKKKCVSLFVEESKTPKQIVEELKTIFSGQKTPKVKACRRYIRKAGHKINGK